MARLTSDSVQRVCRITRYLSRRITKTDSLHLVLFRFLSSEHHHQCRLLPRPLACHKSSSTASSTSLETTLVRFVCARLFRNRGSTVVGSTSSRPCIYRRVFCGGGWSAFRLTLLRPRTHTTTSDCCLSNPRLRLHHSASRKPSSTTSPPSLKSRNSPLQAASGRNGRRHFRIAP